MRLHVMMEGVSLVTKGRNKMRERQLRWFDHTKQRTMTAPMRRIKLQANCAARKREMKKKKNQKLIAVERG